MPNGRPLLELKLRKENSSQVYFKLESEKRKEKLYTVVVSMFVLVQVEGCCTYLNGSKISGKGDNALKQNPYKMWKVSTLRIFYF